MKRLAELERTGKALAAIIRERDAPERLGEDPGEYLGAAGVHGRDLEVMVAAGSARMLVYRSLVHNRLRHAVRDLIPRTVARLGNAGLREQFTQFMAARAPRSHYLRDVPDEFLEWAAPRWRTMSGI